MQNFKPPTFENFSNSVSVYFYAFILIFVLLSLFCVFYLIPSITDLNKLFSQRLRFQNRVAANADNIALLNDISRLTEDLTRNAAPRETSADKEPNALLSLIDLTSDCDLSVSDFKIYPKDSNGAENVVRPVMINVSGGFDGCTRFLRELQRGEYYFLPDEVEMKFKDFEEINLGVKVYLIIATN